MDRAEGCAARRAVGDYALWAAARGEVRLVILDDRSSRDNPLGDAVETFIRLEDAERFVEEVRGDDPELASCLWIEERQLEAGGRNEER